MVEADAVSVKWEVRQATQRDASAWAALRQELWPEEDAARHLPDIGDILGRPAQAVAFLACDGKGKVIGFAEATLRADYVNGTESSPVGFLEGWFVQADYRQQGAGRLLVAAVEDWTLRQGCTELASDALAENSGSHAAHAACGFEETERVVYFRKPLGA